MLKVKDLLPDTKIEWEGITHEAIPQIFDAATRVRHVKIAGKQNDFEDGMEKAEAEYLTAIAKPEDNEAVKAASGIRQQKEKELYEMRNKMFAEWGELAEHLYPTIKGLGWFDEEPKIPLKAVNIITSYIDCLIMGVEYKPNSARYTHGVAEIVLNKLADEKAKTLNATRDEVLKAVEESLEKK